MGQLLNFDAGQYMQCTMSVKVYFAVHNFILAAKFCSFTK
jgi:hypothetical protein